MAEVSVNISGRSYRIGCDSGQEERVKSLAARIDAEAKALSAGGGQITESRLLLMSALMLADKLDEAEAAASQASLFSEMDPAEARSLIENASARLEALQGAGEKAD